jgi:hypothetical protein
MNGFEIDNLIQAGATDKARQKLKKLSIPDRLKTLSECIPYVKQTPSSLDFFQKNFAQEIGALIMAHYDVEKAAFLYNNAKALK